VPSEDLSSRLATAANYAGIAARYSFYLTGTFMFAVFGLSAVTIWRWNSQLKPVEAKPVLQITATVLASLPVTSNAIKTRSGWKETLQYGHLYDRDTDFTLVMTMPINTGIPTRPDWFGDSLGLPAISSGLYYPTTNYDLETRFGAVRAAEFRITTDGRVKLCVSFLSRFDSGALSYKGWFCEANGARPNVSALACMLDRISLKAPLPSNEAQAFFTQRQARPGRCSADPVTQTTDTGYSPRQLRRLLP
jgi:hypothetical protein